MNWGELEHQTVSFPLQPRKELFNAFLQWSLYKIKTGNRQEIPALYWFIVFVVSLRVGSQWHFFFFLGGEWLHFTGRFRVSLYTFSMSFSFCFEWCILLGFVFHLHFFRRNLPHHPNKNDKLKHCKSRSAATPGIAVPGCLFKGSQLLQPLKNCSIYFVNSACRCKSLWNKSCLFLDGQPLR